MRFMPRPFRVVTAKERLRKKRFAISKMLFALILKLQLWTLLVKILCINKFYIWSGIAIIDITYEEYRIYHMAQKLYPKLQTARLSSDVMENILKEIRLLRNEISLILPREELSGYSHPARVRRSYRRALKAYSPVWK